MEEEEIKINYIAWVQEGFTLFTQNWAKWCQISFFALVLQILPFIIGALLDSWVNNPIYSFLNQGGILFWIFVIGPLTHSLYRIAFLQDEEGSFEIQDLYHGFQERYWDFTQFWLLIYVVILALAYVGEMWSTKLGLESQTLLLALAVTLFVVFYFAVKILFLFPLMVDQELKWQEAYKLSNQLVMKKLGGFLLFFLLLQFIQSLGFYLCYIGYIISYPLIFCITLAAYKDLYLISDGEIEPI